jgi:hypothetical protein
MVVLLPVCQNNIAVFHDGRLFSLPVTVPMAAEVPERAVNRMLRSMDVSANVELHCIGAKGNVQFWRVDILHWGVAVSRWRRGGCVVACVGDVRACFVIFVRAQDRTAAGPLFAECG